MAADEHVPHRRNWRDAERTPAVIAPGHTLRVGHRQDQRDRAGQAHAASAGSSASASRSCLLMVLLVTHRQPAADRHRHLGQQHPGRLGLRHHQLRLVDRHRPRRHADLGDSAAAPPGVAHLDQPLRRGDDAVRGGLRGHLPAAAHRPAVAGVYWLFPYPNTMGLWPQFRSPLIWDVFAVSTYGTVSLLFWFVGPDSRPGDAARPREAKAGAKRSTACSSLGWRGSARHWQRYEIGLPAAGRPLDAAGALGALGRELRLRGVGAARLARHDLPALLRRRRDLLRASRW